MSEVNRQQVGGNHYQTPIAHWDYVLANDIPYLEAQIIKYLTRWRKKNGLEDVLKAKHFLDKLLDVEQAKVQEVSKIIGSTIRVDDWRIRGEVILVAKIPGIITDLYTSRIISVDDPDKQYLIGSFIEVRLGQLSIYWRE